MVKKMNKKELIEVLVNDYGYDKTDLKDEDGKQFTNAKLESMIKQEDNDAKDLEARESVTVARQTFKDDDQILIMNGRYGSLTHRSQSTGRVWKFADFGQTQKIPYSELLSIRNINPKVFNEGWMIVLNTQIQEDFGLIEQYKNILTPDNINGIFNKSVEELNSFIDSLPEGMKITLVSKARELYEGNKMDSMKMIKFIQEKFNISFDDNAPLSDTVE